MSKIIITYLMLHLLKILFTNLYAHLGTSDTIFTNQDKCSPFLLVVVNYWQRIIICSNESPVLSTSVRYPSFFKYHQKDRDGLSQETAVVVLVQSTVPFELHQGNLDNFIIQVILIIFFFEGRN